MVIKKKSAEKVATKKSASKSAGVKKLGVTKKSIVSQERFYAMVSEAAYFAAQNDANQKDSSEYWIEAEAAIRAQFDLA